MVGEDTLLRQHLHHTNRVTMNIRHAVPGQNKLLYGMSDVHPCVIVSLDFLHFVAFPLSTITNHCPCDINFGG